MVPWKYSSNFWKTLEMLLINWEINLILIWFTNCVLSDTNANQATKFKITDTILYLPVLTINLR